MNTHARTHRPLSLARVAALAAALALPLGALAQQRSFATPEAAVAAFTEALKTNDETALRAIFGSQHADLLNSGDAAADTERRKAFAASLASYSALRELGSDRRTLLVGTRAWPFPIPLERSAGGWRFATEAGAEEVLNRRVGANERNAIHVLNAYVDAQRRYAARDRDGDGVLQYARKLTSSSGKHDGLYWPADPAKDAELSPLGPLLAESSIDPATRKAGEPYQGYRFKILTAQGKSAPGGAYNYVINGRMLAGFAMVAWPADYGASGVMTFIVSHNGKVYEKDLGPNSAGAAAAMTSFDPGAGWKEVFSP